MRRYFVFLIKNLVCYFILLMLIIIDKILFFWLFENSKMNTSKDELYNLLLSGDVLYLPEVYFVFGYITILIQSLLLLAFRLDRRYFDNNLMLIANIFIPFLFFSLWRYLFQFELIGVKPNFLCWVFGVCIYAVILIKRNKVDFVTNRSQN
jgi:hypothetical protein